MTSQPRFSEVTAFAPATVANVACGFDVLGFALQAPGDHVRVRLREEPGIVIEAVEGDGGLLPTDPEKNTAGVAAIWIMNQLGSDRGLALTLTKSMPMGSGMGSSAAGAAAAAFAVNHLFGDPLTKEQLLPACLEAEYAACGHAHADNVAPALRGGIVLVRSYEPLDVVDLPVPRALHAAVLLPKVNILTREARDMLGDHVALRRAVAQWGNLAGLVAGLFREDYQLIGRSLKDHIAEPIRGKLIPHFSEAKAAALSAGALGCSISGSGPAVFALTQGPDLAEKAAQAMARVYRERGLDHQIYVSPINVEGPSITASVPL